MKNIAFLVLAAGESSRMKRIKQLEKINNQTLLDITLEKVKKVFFKNIFCVVGANADKIKAEIITKNIQFIDNPNFRNGLSTSIISGINYFNEHKLNFDGLFILLADQPAIETRYLRSMLDLFQENETKIIASNYGNKLGVPAIFSKKYFSELLLISGDKGAKEFIHQRKNEVIAPKLTTIFFDIDTQEDLKKYKNSIL